MSVLLGWDVPLLRKLRTSIYDNANNAELYHCRWNREMKRTLNLFLGRNQWQCNCAEVHHCCWNWELYRRLNLFSWCQYMTMLLSWAISLLLKPRTQPKMNFIVLASIYDILKQCWVVSLLLNLKIKTKTKFILLASINENANNGELFTKQN